MIRKTDQLLRKGFPFFFFKSRKITTFVPAKGSVVQLYRTSDSGSEGLGLESQRGHYSQPQIFCLGWLFSVRKFIFEGIFDCFQ